MNNYLADSLREANVGFTKAGLAYEINQSYYFDGPNVITMEGL